MFKGEIESRDSELRDFVDQRKWGVRVYSVHIHCTRRRLCGRIIAIKVGMQTHRLHFRLVGDRSDISSPAL